MRFCKFFLGLAVLFSPFIAVHNSSASILITPTQVVLEDRDRFAVVTLVNNGREVKSYEIGWKAMEMIGGNGGYKDAEYGEGDFDLSQYIVFSPRRVTLVPGAKQKIRLALRRPESIPDGDYHTHLMFKSLPNVVDDTLVALEKDHAEASVRINVNYTIPVVLRVGQADYSASIGQMEMVRNTQSGALEAKIPVVRDGKYSVLGWLKLYHISADGVEELVGEVSNANLFSEIQNRILTSSVLKELSGGRLRVVLHYYDFEKNIVYAEREFPLE
ncbi:MAG: hypothetical protein ACRBDI_09365 [Alphaproteobacteria bacterium]